MAGNNAFLHIEGCDTDRLFSDVKTPCYVIDEKALITNGEILKSVCDDTGCRILLAQKAFSNFTLYPLLSQYINGTEASGLFEARLGYEEMLGKEVHVFCAGYRSDEFEELLKYADHIVFNTPTQLRLFGKRAKASGKSIGLRINPECSTQEGHEIYDPCAPKSRLGTTRALWDELMTDELVSVLDGLHFHTLCEQDADDLQKTLTAVEEKFSDVLPKMKWLNMGGGHHITREGYNIELLKKLITYAQEKWGVTVYLEPGEAHALNAGYLVTRVLDLFRNGDTDIAILDMSAACHTPDVIEMPYTPPLYNSGKEGEPKYNYRLGCPTCLSGDIVGDYSFDKPLQVGDMLIFGDMAIYSTCKSNTFNGMALPDILLLKSDRSIEVIKSFDYHDFKNRLG